MSTAESRLKLSFEQTSPYSSWLNTLFKSNENGHFDWSEERPLIGGVWRKILAAHLKLRASTSVMITTNLTFAE